MKFIFNWRYVSQVAGLEKLGVTTCVAVNGTPSSPERTGALKTVRCRDPAHLPELTFEPRSRAQRG
ncbi:MAG: hypothetical protein OXB92_08630 [Acidimicrobiaceae bacterium]|nr:hypothetical protein [Acidimicrobiia bacterium]MCY4493904.1 hypothetical protein [Acidimicrobiaceae bacterium]